MDTAYSAERRAFLRVLATTTAALAAGGCGGGSAGSWSAAASASSPSGPNLPPVWLTVPTITFTQGIQSSVSIAPYVSDPNGNALAITISGGLPGVSFDAATKRLVYDGTSPVGSTNGVVLTANDGQQP